MACILTLPPEVLSLSLSLSLTHTGPSVSEILSSEGSKASFTNTDCQESDAASLRFCQNFGMRAEIRKAEGTVKRRRRVNKVYKAATGGSSFKDRTQAEILRTDL